MRCGDWPLKQLRLSNTRMELDAWTLLRCLRVPADVALPLGILISLVVSTIWLFAVFCGGVLAGCWLRF